MNKEIVITADGSTTIKIKEWDEQYHSLHGAIAEANHVFIAQGLDCAKMRDGNQKLSILELGFGTGLNAWLTALEAEKRNINIDYTGLEAYPLEQEELLQLNYPTLLSIGEVLFNDIHKCNWNEFCEISDSFHLKKQKIKVQDTDFNNEFDLIYFDAFGARVQPELWTASIFKKMIKALKVNGILVTYSAKGSVRRAMLEVGFTVEKLPGPPGKREMLRAIKTV